MAFCAYVVALFLAANGGNAARTKAAIRNHAGQVCVMSEQAGVLDYGVTFGFALPAGKTCSIVSCNIHKFKSFLPSALKARAVDGKCLCSASGKRMFAFGGNTCDSWTCLQQYASVMAVSKRKTQKIFEAKDYIDSGNHWNASCGDEQTSLPSISNVLVALSDDGLKKEADTIQKMIDVYDDDDEDTNAEMVVDAADEDGTITAEDVVEDVEDDWEAEPERPVGCPIRVTWNIKDDKRCHSVPGMRFVKTLCCRHLL